MSKMITLVVEVVIFASLIGVIASQITAAAGDGNVTGAAAVMLGLTTLFVVIGFVVAILKTSGLKTGR
jgi:hypothetical protein